MFDVLQDAVLAWQETKAAQAAPAIESIVSKWVVFLAKSVITPRR